LQTGDLFMLKKTLATIALAILACLSGVAILPVPGPAHADSFTPAGPVTVSVTGDAHAGGTVVVAFGAGSFIGGERMSVTATGSGMATLGLLRAATNTHGMPADSAGALSIDVTLPKNATGTYTLIATGLASGTVGVATVTVAGVTAFAQPRPNSGDPGSANTDAEGSTDAGPAAGDQGITVSGDDASGGTSTIAFAEESFAASEDVSFSVAGSGSATLATVRAGTVTFVKPADAAGAVSVNVTLPADATGFYTVTATGRTSHLVRTVAVTVGASAAAPTVTATVRTRCDVRPVAVTV